MKKKFNDQDHLYLHLADAPEKMKVDQTLKIVYKLPSVRALSD